MFYAKIRMESVISPAGIQSERAMPIG